MDLTRPLPRPPRPCGFKSTFIRIYPNASATVGETDAPPLSTRVFVRPLGIAREDREPDKLSLVFVGSFMPVRITQIY